MTPGQHLSPDYSLGDESTVGGYAAVHARPAALEGRHGLSYSLDVLTDTSEDPSRPFGAYLLFVQWSRMGAQKVDGHLESGFVAWGASPDEADRALRAMPLTDVQQILDTLIRDRDGDSSRRWWDVMREDTGDDA